MKTAFFLFFLCLALAAGVGYWSFASSKPPPGFTAEAWENFSWETWDPGDEQGRTWAEMEPVLSRLPSLPPNVGGVVLDDGTTIPRSYFDRPRVLRIFYTPEPMPPAQKE